MGCGIVQTISEELPEWDYEYTIAHYPVERCNFNCSYCNMPPACGLPSRSERNRVWWDLRRKYGHCRVVISGGEPTLDMETLAEISEVHYIVLNTNMSFDTDELCNSIDPKRVVINPFWHGVDISGNIKEMIGRGYSIGTVFIIASDVDALDIKTIESSIGGIDRYILGVREGGQEDNIYVDGEIGHDRLMRCKAGCRFFVVDVFGNMYKCDNSSTKMTSLTMLSDRCGISSCKYGSRVKSRLVTGR